MKQYIITEEERKKMLKAWSVIQQHIDWQHNACHTLNLTVQDAYNIMEIVRSHPYNPQEGRISKAAVAGSPPLAIHDKLIRQAEREKVLDEVRAKYIERNDIPCPELAEKYDHCCDSEYCGICILDFVLEELRKGEP